MDLGSSICTCVTAKQTSISLEFYCLFDVLFMFYQAFGMNLSFDRCSMFVAGVARKSIRYCASIRMNMVTQVFPFFMEMNWM